MKGKKKLLHYLNLCFLSLAPCFLFLTFCLLLPLPVHAAFQWSLSVVEGYYFPRLDELNYVLTSDRVELGPRNTEAKPVSYPVIYQGASPSMPEMEPEAPRIGFQLQADVNPRYAVVFGGTVATLESSRRDVRNFFVGFWIPANRETRFSILLNQFWLGAKRYWIREKKGKGEKKEKLSTGKEKERGRKPQSRFYAEMGILALTRVTLTTDVWLHVYAPEEGFDFYKVTETESRGSGFGTYIGGGGEIYIREWLSLGLDIDYTIGGVTEMKYARYFTVDPLEKDIIKPGEQVLYTDLEKGQIVPLFIDLEGWDIKGQVRFYF